MTSESNNDFSQNNSNKKSQAKFYLRENMINWDGKNDKKTEKKLTEIEFQERLKREKAISENKQTKTNTQEAKMQEGYKSNVAEESEDKVAGANGENNIEIDVLDDEATDGNKTSNDFDEDGVIKKSDFIIMKDAYIRLAADFENYKKRTKDSSSKMYAEGVSDTLTKIFPVLDSFELGINNGEGIVKDGLNAVYKQFLEILNKLNIEEVGAVGDVFDPNLHDAVLSVDDDQNAGKVVEVLKRGYKLNDKVLRYAMVKVAK